MQTLKDRQREGFVAISSVLLLGNLADEVQAAVAAVDGCLTFASVPNAAVKLHNFICNIFFFS